MNDTPLPGVPESDDVPAQPERAEAADLSQPMQDTREHVLGTLSERTRQRDASEMSLAALLQGEGPWTDRMRAQLGVLHGQLQLAEHSARMPLSAGEAALYAYCAIGTGNTDAARNVESLLQAAIRLGGVDASEARYLLGKIAAMRAGKAEGAERLALTQASVTHWSAVEAFAVSRRGLLLPGTRSELPAEMLDGDIAVPEGADAVAHGILPPDRYCAAGEVAVATQLLHLDPAAAALHARRARGHVQSWIHRRGENETRFGRLNVETCDVAAQATLVLAERGSLADALSVRSAGDDLIAHIRGEAHVPAVKKAEWEAYVLAGQAMITPPAERGALLAAMVARITETLRIRPAAAGIFRFDGTYVVAFQLLDPRDRADLEKMLHDADAGKKPGA